MSIKPNNTPAQQRADAARALSQILKHGRTIDWVEHSGFLTSKSAFTMALVYGSCRYFYSLRTLVDANLAKPLRAKDHDIYMLLLVGAYQLQYAQTKPHAAINETVSACKVLKRPWAKGLVNAVLRQISTTKTACSFELPAWLTARFKEDHGLNPELLSSCIERAPMTLRINTVKISPAEYRQKLTDADCTYELTDLDEAVILVQPIPASELPGWSDGEVAVQDLGAQYVARLCADLLHAISSPARMLDACAAPGGKLFHILEITSERGQPASFTSLESSEPRNQAMASIASRLGHTGISMLLADATTQNWWDRVPYDVILLDAPCSGTGTLRRHPDIKLLLQPDDIAAHAQIQLQLLHNLWSTLAVGGTLVYCTCSLLAAENDHVIREFLSSTKVKSVESNAVVERPHLPTGQPTDYGWQLLPTDSKTDGFFISLLAKQALEIV